MMYFADSHTQDTLLSAPESGMGYQIIEARNSLQGYKTIERYIVYNSEIVLLHPMTLSDSEKDTPQEIHHEKQNQRIVDIVNLRDIKLVDRNRGNTESVRESSEKYGSVQTGHGARDNKVQHADGRGVFVRLSAFENDRRIDRESKRLLNGAFATTLLDYNRVFGNKLDPND